MTGQLSGLLPVYLSGSYTRINQYESLQTAVLLEIFLVTLCFTVYIFINDKKNKYVALQRDLEEKMNHHKLTPKQKEITRLILKGKNSKSISMELNITENTIKSHKQEIFRKLNVSKEFELYKKEKFEKLKQN